MQKALKPIYDIRSQLMGRLLVWVMGLCGIWMAVAQVTFCYIGTFLYVCFTCPKGVFFKNWVMETGWKDLKEEGTRHIACVDTVFGIQLPKC